MPDTVNLQPHLIPTIITEKRLDAYKSVFSVSSELELVGTYLWNLNACAALYPLLNHTEITIRNSVDRVLADALGYFWWSTGNLHFKSFQANGPLPDVVKKIRGNFKSAFKTVQREKEERYGISLHPADHDEVIAATEFSTWEYMFDREFMDRGLIWPAHLGRVLRGKWPHSKAGKTLDAVKRDIKAIRNFRNRLSHHEPVWKAYRITSENDAIDYLQRKIDAVENLTSMFSGDSALMLRRNNFFSHARLACSSGELERFKYRSKKHNIKSLAAMTRAVNASGSASLSLKFYTDRRRAFLLVPVEIG